MLPPRPVPIYYYHYYYWWCILQSLAWAISAEVLLCNFFKASFGFWLFEIRTRHLGKGYVLRVSGVAFAERFRIEIATCAIPEGITMPKNWTLRKHKCQTSYQQITHNENEYVFIHTTRVPMSLEKHAICQDLSVYCKLSICNIRLTINCCLELFREDSELV